MLNQSRYSLIFVFIVTLFVTCLITANIIAVKLIVIGGIVFPAGIIIFPIDYIVGDVLTEVYGYPTARKVILFGFICNLIFVVAASIAGALPAAGFWTLQPAYDSILGFAPKLLMASFLAYLVGENANSWVLAKMKIATKSRWLWTRTIGSTIVGEGLDSLIFIGIAFSGSIPQDALLNLVLTQWLFKCVYEIICTPITYLVINSLKRREGLES